MNYEDKYNQTIESIKRIYNQADSYGKELMEKEFPELRESEDERIRKEIIQSIQDNMCVVHKDKCIAWLEKQGEQKPIMAKQALLQMAKWKDRQTKQLLIEKTKLLSSSAAQDSVKRCTIEEIYRELFNEEMPNSNPYIK